MSWQDRSKQRDKHGDGWSQSGRGRLIRQVCKQKASQSLAPEEDNKIKQEVRTRRNEATNMAMAQNLKLFSAQHADADMIETPRVPF